MNEVGQQGMTPRETWERSTVHQVSRYSCSKCGKGFKSPDAVYDHLDAEHAAPEKEGKR